MHDQPAYIYILRHPSSGAVRYVGFTESLETRRKYYRQKPPDDAGRTVTQWRRSLREEGLSCNFEVIERINPGVSRRRQMDAERWWIHRFLDLGFDLLNERKREDCWKPTPWKEVKHLFE